MKSVVIDGKKVCVEANASTLLIYEDRFKGRRLLKDITEIAKIENGIDVPLSLYTKFLWAAAKTADESIPDIDEWSKEFSINGILEGGRSALELICKSLSTAKKRKAAVSHRVACRLLKFFHLQSNAD